MTEYIEREAAIAYIREQSEECQKAFEELGGESGIYADAYNDLAEDFYSIPAADVAPVVHGRWSNNDIPAVDAVPVVRCQNCKYYALWADGRSMNRCDKHECTMYDEDFCSYGERKDGES